MREGILMMNRLLARGRLLRLVLGCLMVWPALLVAAASRRGPGMTWDSVHYAAAARSFVESGLFLGFDGREIELYPPGYSFVLGSSVKMGIDLELAAVLINMIGVAATVLLTFGIMR